MLLEPSVMYFENKMKLYLYHSIEENITRIMSDTSFNFINFISVYASFLCKIPLEERKKIFKCFVGKSGNAYKLDLDFDEFNETVDLIVQSSHIVPVISEEHEDSVLKEVYNEIMKHGPDNFEKFKECNERLKRMYGISPIINKGRKRKRDNDDDKSNERPKKRVKK